MIDIEVTFVRLTLKFALADHGAKGTDRDLGTLQGHHGGRGRLVYHATCCGQHALWETHLNVQKMEDAH